MSYNTGREKWKSTVLLGLDCGFAVKGVPVEDNYPEARFTFTTSTVLAPGECVAMLRIPANTIVLGGELYWSKMSTGGILAVGDPFACARLIGPVHTVLSRGVQSAFTILGGVGTCDAWGTCGSLRKLGVEGDGCGIGYRYTCETDIVLTNLYSDRNATAGGWQGSDLTVGSQVGAAVSAGTVHLILHTKKATSVQ